jgi:murein DD-endopeptidase MepM/ murein hydrolase activator NlpD
MTARGVKFLKKIVKRYRLSIYDREKLIEVMSFPVSRARVLLAVFLIAALSVTSAYFLVFYTRLKLFMPDYPSPQVWRSIHYNSIMIDSLIFQIEQRDRFINNINSVITGNIPDSSEEAGFTLADYDVEIEKNQNEPIFEKLIGPDVYHFNFSESTSFDEMDRINFFPPIKGVVINRFSSSPGHYGTDIVGRFDTNIYSVLDGTVIFAEWSTSTGYVIQIQHKHDLVSVYKHNSGILIQQGDKVKAGEVIAIMGNEGELSTGPHLHFELWRKGVALDPEQYINF